MATAEELREQAALLLALSIRAREKGDIEYSNLLITRATRYLDEAQAIERGEPALGDPPPIPAPSEPKPTAQQQQQPQPKTDRKEGETE
jgi:hypothetical protein